MATILFANNASTRLAGSLNDTDTTAFLATGSGVLFPNPGAGEYFVLTFSDQALSVREIVHVTARTGDEITIVRAQEGTSARSWLANDHAAELWTAGQARAMAQGASGVGGGAAQHLYDPSDLQALTALSLTLGNAYQYIYADATNQDGSGGTVEVLDATGSGLVDGVWHYDATLHRSYMLGAGTDGSKPRLFKVLVALEDLRSWGLDCDNGSGGDSIITTAATTVRQTYHADIIATSAGPPLGGVGVHTLSDTVDLHNANWNAPQLTVMAPTGFTSILPALRFGRVATDSNSRLDVPTSINAAVKGNGTSNFSSISNQIGVQLYDLASPTSEIDVNCSRSYRALDFGANSEKLDARVGGAYNWQLCGYSPVQVSAVYGGTTPVIYPLWPYLRNMGSWNANTNGGSTPQGTPAINSGTAPANKGKYYRVGTVTGPVATVDGTSSWSTGDWIFSDGVTWTKRSVINFSPDSNRVHIFGETNVQYLFIPDAADCSGTFIINAEGRYDPGPAYDIVNFQGVTVPIPAIQDGNGKEIVIQEGSWARAGDQRLFYYGNKDNGVDTTKLGFNVDHLYGTVVRIDRALNVVFGGLYKDVQDGRYAGNSTPIPCPVVQLGAIGTIMGQIQIVGATNREGILGGDVTLGLTLQNNWVSGTVKMGVAAGVNDISAGRGLTALRGQALNNVVFDLRNSQGNILLPDLCADGTTPTSMHRVTTIVDPAWCATAAISNALPAYQQGGSVGAGMIVRGGMTLADARSAVANFVGATDVLFEDIYGRGPIRYNGSRWSPG